MIQCIIPLVVVLLELFVVASASSSLEDCDRAMRYIDPFIGTTGVGYAGGQGSPAAQVTYTYAFSHHSMALKSIAY
jgi:hypothetical protein